MIKLAAMIQNKKEGSYVKQFNKKEREKFKIGQDELVAGRENKVNKDEIGKYLGARKVKVIILILGHSIILVIES